jgi:hypothetical protein
MNPLAPPAQTMDTEPRRPRMVLVAALTFIGLFYLIFLGSSVRVIAAMHTGNQPTVMTPAQELPQADFAMFWYSGRLLTIRFADALGLHVTASPWLLHTFQIRVWTSLSPFQLSWLYPPTMGLLAVAYAALPLGVSFWVWRGLYLAISALLLRRAGLAWHVILMGLASPAELVDFQGGQNGALTGGILVASLLLIERAPGPGGALAALLSIKPQLGLALPFILLRARYRRALLLAVLVFAMLFLLTLPLEGLHAWLWFLGAGRRASVALISRPFAQALPAAGATVFFMARGFGASIFGAWLVQGAVSLPCLWWLWRLWGWQDAEPVSRLALTLCLAALITPYFYLYDMVGLAIAMAMMFFRVPDARKPLYGLVWLFTGYSGTLAHLTGHVFMPVAAALGAFLAWRELDG